MLHIVLKNPIRKDNETSNPLNHLQVCHEAKYKEATAKENHRKLASATKSNTKTTSASTYVQQSIFGGSSEKTLTKNQIDREFVAWIVNSSRADNLALDIGFRIFTTLLSGAEYLPP